MAGLSSELLLYCARIDIECVHTHREVHYTRTTMHPSVHPSTHPYLWSKGDDNEAKECCEEFHPSNNAGYSSSSGEKRAGVQADSSVGQLYMRMCVYACVCVCIAAGGFVHLCGSDNAYVHIHIQLRVLRK